MPDVCDRVTNYDHSSTSSTAVYDYLELPSQGVICVVRGYFVHDQNHYVVAKRMHRLCSSTGRYHKEAIVASFATNTLSVRTLPGLFPTEEVFRSDDDQLTRHSRIRLSATHIHSANAETAPVLEYLTRRGAYLFGSRLLGVAHPHSDWDVVVEGCHDPRRFAHEMALRFPHVLRPYTSTEKAHRAGRYLQTCSFTDTRSLQRLIGEATLYLRFRRSHSDLGLFFVELCPPLLPDLFRCDEWTSATLTGTIESLGHGYSMPRRFGVRAADGTLLTVATTAWELGGLDTLAGTPVLLRDLKHIDRNYYWFAADSLLLLELE